MAELATITERQDRVGTEPRPIPLWFRFMMPSITDLVFLTIFFALTFTGLSNNLLHDAGTGWHIRNGDYILATHTVPHQDLFSYTASSKPWFAWEWLYEVGIAAIHRVAGLNGIVVLSALLIALTFSLLFSLAFRSGRNVAVAGVFTFLAAASSSIHFLARPHLLSWLFTLLYVVLLRSLQDGKRSAAFCIPGLMLVWVNVHGGFVVGIVLICIFAVANLWTWLTAACPTKRRKSAGLAAAFGVVAFVTSLLTLVNPYGYRLWAHLYEFLGNSFLIGSISEYQSPNFHWFQMKFFAALLLVSVAAIAFASAKVRALDVLLILFAVYAGLYAARNVPVTAIILTVTLVPLVSRSVADAAEDKSFGLAVRRRLTSFASFTSRMDTIESSLRGHLIPTAAVLFAVVVAFHGGRLGSKQLLDAHWDSSRMPVAALDFLQSQSIRDHFFSPDDWGGYVIYRMYPNVRVFTDDRFDLYGEAFVRDYLKVAKADPHWAEVLNRYGVAWVLTPAESPLSTVLEASPGWKLLHSDGTARVYGRSDKH